MVILTSCSDDDVLGRENVKKGNVINFDVSAAKSRANYNDGIDSKQVRWESGDKIRIFSKQALLVADGTPGVSADYNITPKDDNNANDDHKELATITAADASRQLLWGDENTPHKFFAVYPANDNIKMDSEGVITFPINRNQVCTIRDKKEGENYTYVAEPKDENIYMVASSEENPANLTDGSVWLDFKPIMTTINIVIQGPSETYENAEAVSDLITGVSIISTITTTSNATKDVFYYDAVNEQITTAPGTTTSTTTTTYTETTFISLETADGLNAPTLKTGETLCLTAFLPPTKNVEGVVERDLSIRVHTTGGGSKTQSLTDVQVTAMTPSAKGSIKLPVMWRPITGANWITPLDDDIYVAQLSIPGTHDSATEHCTDPLLGASNSGKCQQLSILEQLKMGIRFFDIRPTGSNLNIYHGLYPCYKEDTNGEQSETILTLTDIYNDFNTFLKENPGEFIITILRWESEGNDDENSFNSAMQQFVQNEPYTTYALPRSILDKNLKNLTIGDMRENEQGKILTIMRPNQGSSPDWYIYGTETTKAPDGMMFISGFPGSHATGTTNAYLKDAFVNYTDQWASRTDWIVYCQNYYKVCSEGLGGLLGNGISGETAVSNKLASVKTYIEHATTQAKNGDNIWVINHCSGYRGSSAIFSAYAELAEDLNPNIYEYIMNREEPGCLGAILLDFVGTRTFNARNVYGDLLPQTIIDNNYKYRMIRRGE